MLYERAIRAVVLATLWWTTVATSPSLAASKRAGVTIGCFCIDGVSGRGGETNRRTVTEGTWVPWTFELTPQGRPDARLFVFDNTLPASEALLSCDEIATEASEAGINLLVAGKLAALPRLEGHLFISNTGAGNRFRSTKESFEPRSATSSPGP